MYHLDIMWLTFVKTCPVFIYELRMNMKLLFPAYIPLCALLTLSNLDLNQVQNQELYFYN